mgnify:CR=1 FL=1|jgi:hypothetical protein
MAARRNCALNPSLCKLSNVAKDSTLTKPACQTFKYPSLARQFPFSDPSAPLTSFPMKRVAFETEHNYTIPRTAPLWQALEVPELMGHWNCIVDDFFLLPQIPGDISKYLESLRYLDKQGMRAMVVGAFILSAEKVAEESIVPATLEFSASMDSLKREISIKSFDYTAFCLLMDHIATWRGVVENVLPRLLTMGALLQEAFCWIPELSSASLSSKLFSICVHEEVHEDAWKYATKLLCEASLAIHIRSFSARDDDDDDDDDSESSDSDAWVESIPLEKQAEFCLNWRRMLNQLPPLTPSLRTLGMEVLTKAIERKCASYLELGFEYSLLSRAKQWLEAGPATYYQGLQPPREEEGSLFPSSTPGPTAQQLLSSTMTTILLSSLFDVVIDWPESRPVVEDLAALLPQCNMQSEAEDALRHAITVRLLHAGASTSDLIRAYINIVHALRVMDSSGSMLLHCWDGLRHYMKSRHDTIRCILAAVLEDESSDLFGELNQAVGGSETGGGGEGLEIVTSDGEDESTRQWWIDAKTSYKSSAVSSPHRTSLDDPEPGQTSVPITGKDTVALLISIFGAPEMFVTEYRNMLAERILSTADYEADVDIRNVELLKIRFGEQALSNCEVMLSDVADSRRVRSHVTSSWQEKNNTEMLRANENSISDDALPIVDATILSGLYWPPCKNETIRHSPCIARLLEAFATEYNRLKSPRTLNWQTTLGTATIGVELSDGTRDFDVPLPTATLLGFFVEKEEWLERDLLAAAAVTEAVLYRRCQPFINCGLLQPRDGRWLLAASWAAASDYLGTNGGKEEAMLGEVTSIMEEESPVQTATEQLAEGMRVYESFILGMLTNLGSLPIDRIHNMLKMFVQENVYDRTMGELQTLLHTMVQNDLLTLQDGQYAKKV